MLKPLSSWRAEAPLLPFRPRLPRRLTRRAIADTSYVALQSTMWVGGTVLGVLGAAVACFLVIAGGDVDLFFSHVNNLASRYVAADHARRDVFEHGLVQLFVGAALLATIIRLPGFVRRLRRDLQEGPNHERA